MDWSRYTHESRMRLFWDGYEVEVLGRWYFSPPGAKLIPYFHPFALSSWDAEGVEYDETIGEISSSLTRKPAQTSPRVTGQNFLGDRELWENGSSLSQRGTMPLEPDGLPVGGIYGPLELLTLNDGGTGGEERIQPLELRDGGTGGEEDIDLNAVDGTLDADLAGALVCTMAGTVINPVSGSLDADLDGALVCTMSGTVT